MNEIMHTTQSPATELSSCAHAPDERLRTGSRGRMEHRWGERAHVRASVRVHCAKWDASGLMRDASLSGAFVNTRLQVPAWTSIELELDGVRIAAFVVRAASDGIGIEWSEFAPRQVRELLGL